MPASRPSSRASGSTSNRAKPTANKHPARTCVACREQGGKRELVRFVRSPEGQVTLDRTGRAPGRGAYLHATAECFELARKRRALDRALGAPVPPEVLNLS